MPQVAFPQEQPRWSKKVEILNTMKEPTTLDETFSRLAALHGVKCNLQEEPPLEDTPFGGLHEFFKEYSDEEEIDRFLKVIMPSIAILALDIRKNTPVGGVKYSTRNQFKCTPFNRKFIASMLACGFLCMFPEEFKPESATGINFDWFFDVLHEVQEQHEKLRCILHYFDRMSVMYTNLNESVTFTRVYIPENRLYNKDYLLGDPRGLCPLGVYSHAEVQEISPDVITTTFSNRFVGGGVLDRGCSREETTFVTCPELLAALLFMESMDKTECVVINGFEQFSETEGVGKEFQFNGSFKTEYERDIEGNYQTAMVAMDAHPFPHTREGLKQQFLIKYILREVNKAYVGFCQPGTTGSTRNGAEWIGQEMEAISKIYPVNIRSVATGNWGCGSAGGGDYQLKVIIQWIAASIAQVPQLRYFTQRKRDLDDLELLKQDILDNKWSIGRLSKELLKFSTQVETNKDKGYGLFSHLEAALVKDKKKAEKPKCTVL